MNIRMRRLVFCAALMMLMACGALAQENLRPLLDDPVDAMVQRLHIMSQQDEAFEGIKYNNGYIRGRGCQPLSVANAVIASFGIEDEQTAAGVVKESTRLLELPYHHGKDRIELTRLKLLLDPAERAAEQEEYPHLAETIGVYPGQTAAEMKQMDTAELEAFLAKTAPPFVLASRMTVHPDWTALLEQIDVLHAAGMDEAIVCLANVGVGVEKSRTPLRLGKNGHYLTILFHVGTFVQEGRMYVLDSLPRALEGEPSGLDYVLRGAYPFTQEDSEFSRTFEGARIRETVIRLSLKDGAAWTAADREIRAQILEPLILYGPGVLMIAAQ
ncbi:MAG: hypothetical protein IKJ11_07750 [Clostridia bacterium]|nr:hypothetical protein [Clostridia bacterium]